MTKKNITDVVGAIVDELQPLTSEERRRVIQASLTLLGEVGVKNLDEAPDEQGADEESSGKLPNRARSWIKQNNLSLDEIQQVFDLAEEGATVIAPGSPR